jgi:hypothetical protein
LSLLCVDPKDIVQCYEAHGSARRRVEPNVRRTEVGAVRLIVLIAEDSCVSIRTVGATHSRLESSRHLHIVDRCVDQTRMVLDVNANKPL